jgi:hypothetical protein
MARVSATSKLNGSAKAALGTAASSGMKRKNRTENSVRRRF